jgi:hypothetical protein
VIVFIFTSTDAATVYVPDGLSELANVRRDLRAILSIDGGKASLTLTQIGTDSQYFKATASGATFASLYDTDIDLPPAARPQCRLSIDARCVLSLEQLEYPTDALRARLSATVTLAGVVDRNGKATARVLAPGGPQAGTQSVLARAALENVSTWWIEPAPRQSSFEITFAYEIDPKLSPGQSDLQIDFPNSITIRANPEK